MFSRFGECFGLSWCYGVILLFTRFEYSLSFIIYQYIDFSTLVNLRRQQQVAMEYTRTLTYKSMTLANCGTNAGQYQREDWVENQKLTPSVYCPSLFHLLSTTIGECEHRGPYRRSQWDSSTPIFSSRVPPLVTDGRVSELYSKIKIKYRYEGSTCLLKKTQFSVQSQSLFLWALVNYISKFDFFFFARSKIHPFSALVFLVFGCSHNRM